MLKTGAGLGLGLPTRQWLHQMVVDPCVAAVAVEPGAHTVRRLRTLLGVMVASLAAILRLVVGLRARMGLRPQMVVQARQRRPIRADLVEVGVAQPLQLQLVRVMAALVARAAAVEVEVASA